MKRPVAQRVQDALDVMDQARAFVGEMHPAEFAADDRTVFAVERCFTVLGEALRHVPDDVRATYPEVPWLDIIGMRNRVTHDYLYTDREIVWQTVHTDFPVLRSQLARIRDDLQRAD